MKSKTNILRGQPNGRSRFYELTRYSKTKKKKFYQAAKEIQKRNPGHRFHTFTDPVTAGISESECSGTPSKTKQTETHRIPQAWGNRIAD